MPSKELNSSNQTQKDQKLQDPKFQHSSNMRNPNLTPHCVRGRAHDSPLQENSNSQATFSDACSLSYEHRMRPKRALVGNAPNELS